ncbi:hypothetical protein ANN_05031 [Periplaneta americana]|uniref:Reverse transcriptase domain-containing protein n=1 Tax=Periplaneta americana TaxID=6978 RepID=A0ABQ8TAU4_PERAM|nr:hypothetical protein ANN_05031 [Periplaneta americana]
MGNGRPRTVRTPDNIATVHDVVCTEDDASRTSLSARKASRQVGISRSSVRRICKLDLELNILRAQSGTGMLNISSVGRESSIYLPKEVRRYTCFHSYPQHNVLNACQSKLRRGKLQFCTPRHVKTLHMCSRAHCALVSVKCAVPIPLPGRSESAWRENATGLYITCSSRTALVSVTQISTGVLIELPGIVNRWTKYVEEFETENRSDDLAIEDEETASDDEEGYAVLREEVELVLREVENGKATGVDGIPIELVKCLTEDKKEILSLCNEIYEKDDWPEDFTETVLLPIPKKNNAKKCNETVRRRAVWLQEGERYERCNSSELTISEKYLEKNEEAYVVFVDLEKAFDRVDWNKLTRILKEIGVDWKERRLFSNLYMKRVRMVNGRRVRGRKRYDDDDDDDVDDDDVDDINIYVLYEERKRRQK